MSGIKQTDDTGHTEQGSAGNADPDSILLQELSMIEGLDVKTGLSHFGDDAKTYFLLLHQFCDSCDLHIEELLSATKTEKEQTEKDRKYFHVKAHAIKGVMASLGMQTLARQAAKLEQASNPGDNFSFQYCIEQAPLFCTALSDFRGRLCKTKLMEDAKGKKEKPKGEASFFNEQIELLRECCVHYSIESEDIVNGLLEFTWGKETDEALEKIQKFALSYDYGDALEVLKGIQSPDE